MSQFSGLSMPPPHGAPVSVANPNPYGPVPPQQQQQQQNFNGYDSHGGTGYGIPPTSNKAFAPPTNMNNNNIHNGPALRHMQPFTSATPPPFSQNMLQPSSGVATEQLSQRFNDMSMGQKTNLHSGYPPMGGHGPPPPAQKFGPENILGRSPVPPLQHQHDSVQHQQPPYSQATNMQSSISGPYRLSHPSMTQPPASHGPGNQSGMMYPGNQNQRFQVGPAPTPPPTLHPVASGPYSGHGVGPPSSMSGPVVNDVVQNGAYYPGGGDQNVPPPAVGVPSSMNGPGVSPGAPQTFPSQMPPMPSRYPAMPTNSMQGGMPPQHQHQQSQFHPPPPGMNNSQNRMTAPMQQPGANQNRRLDPDHMPSPIQVIEDDRKLHTSMFVTNAKGQVPPLVTTDFVVSDGGTCNPRFMRSTIYTVPTSAEILKQTSVPFAIVLSPFAQLHEGEQPPHISDLGEPGPVRCIRCKAYMCPFMQFIDGGRRFQCIFCKATTEVPPEYFTHLDHMGERVDKYQRPELCLGSYEFVATKEYCKNSTFPKSPAFIFIIDVSYNSIRNGMVKLLCENMKSVLSNLPKEGDDQATEIKVGFISYNSVVHFYNIKSNLAVPQVMVVPDVQEMFMPLLDGFLVSYSEAEPLIENLLEQIPEMYVETRETEIVLGPAIQAGLEALKAADCAGKLFVFHSTLPIIEAPGKLKNRDDRKLLGTEKEKTVLSPQTPFYNNLGQECVAAGCCVDLFLFPNAYIDVATVGQVCRLTGGQLYKYTYFQSDIDGTRFLEDLRRDVSKPIAFDAIVRVRTSTGIRPTEFWGNFYMSNTTDIEFAAIDCDKAIGVEIKFDDKLGEEDGAYIQTAILYTSCAGQRRLRVHNMALNTSSQMAELFRNCELDTIMNVFSKEAIHMITEQTPRQVKDNYITRSAQILACYRKHCANRSSAGQLILPECMKLLPLYINCLIKSDAIAGGQDMSTDERSFVMLALNSMNVESSACYFYPRLLPLHDIDTDSDELPTAMRCTIDKINDNGVYLIENGLMMFLWVGMNVKSEWIQDVFAVPTAARIDIDSTKLVEINTPLSRRIRNIVNQIQKERKRFMKLVIVRQGDKLELVFRLMLVEDRTTEGSASYVDFLCHLHKEIRTLLS